MINGDLLPLRGRPTAKSKRFGQRDNAAQFLGGDPDYRVSLSRHDSIYSTAVHGWSSGAKPTSRGNKPQFGMSLGTKMHAARKAAKKTQEQIAEAIGKTKSAVSQWETNGTTPTLGQFRAFCVITGASADELLLGKKLSGLEKRIAALPDALLEYVMLSLQMAEETRPHIPDRFLTPPTKQTYQAFHDYLTELAEKRPTKVDRK